MTIPRDKIRWNGWGWVEAPDILGDKQEGVWRWMAEVFGLESLPATPAPALDACTLPEAHLSQATLDALRMALHPERVKTDRFERAFHARGKSYPDLVTLRSARFNRIPDAVVYPESDAECLALLHLAGEKHFAVVPFGGGSSVVGGVTPIKGPSHQGVVVADMTRMNRLLEIDETSQVATFEAGVYGPHLEEQLQARGYTLGHYPQSFEFSTLGGWIAPRSAGHQSNKYGKAEHWLVGAQVATPSGLWHTQSFPGSAAGPQLRDMVAGSEGVLGIITNATVRIHPVPEKKDYRAYLFMDFAQAVTAVRTLMQAEVPTAMIRLSDPDESYFYGALKSAGEGMDPSVRVCVMLVGFEGGSDEVAHQQARSQAIIEANGGAYMGEELAQEWYAHRFETPYLRDPMLDRGLGVDTLETAGRWAQLMPLYDATGAAIREALTANPGRDGAKAICMAHISHCYRDGASLYFTFAFVRDPEAPLQQWRAVKRAASDAIVANGGTISHHHGVGIDHIPWMVQEVGPIGLDALRALKHEFDPDGVMNPGKLVH
ncbi:MAG: FAD-binding oxidoreductase [Candidatus Hydrogenedentota bacterium]